jgi:hypothetical protein
VKQDNVIIDRCTVIDRATNTEVTPGGTLHAIDVFRCRNLDCRAIHLQVTIKSTDQVISMMISPEDAADLALQLEAPRFLSEDEVATLKRVGEGVH